MDTAPLKALQPQSVSLRSALAADPTAQLRQRSRDARELHSLDEYHVALESRAGIVVGFTAPWCGPCMDIFPRFRELAQSYSNIACFVVDVEENNDTALECGIIELPTFLFYRLGQKVRVVTVCATTASTPPRDRRSGFVALGRLQCLLMYRPEEDLPHAERLASGTSLLISIACAPTVGRSMSSKAPVLRILPSKWVP